MVIDTTSVASGSYVLVLESFDENDANKVSKLLTDTITVEVLAPIELPEFTDQLETIIITLGEPKSWSLPPIKEGTLPFAGAQLEIEILF